MKNTQYPSYKVLAVHNYYKLPGGEDKCFEDEVKMLRERGHEVQTLTVHNQVIDRIGKFKLATQTIWNRDSASRMKEYVRRERFDVVHFHNTFPLLSPSVYAAVRSEGAAAVQMLQNYRLLCPGAFLMRDGKVCEDCLGSSIPWAAVKHRCYRGSRLASAVVAGMTTAHRVLRTWQNQVDVYLAMTEFGRNKFIEGGLPAEKILVKPNFVNPAPESGTGEGGYALFVGRLSQEKGLDTLLAAWEQLSEDIPLKIVGGGPLESQVREAAANDPRIEYMGFCDTQAVYGLMGKASCLMFPSIWYEGLPKTIVESFACGTPVLTSNIGAQAEVVVQSETGLHFKVGDAEDMRYQIALMFGDRLKLSEMRRTARETYEKLYGESENYHRLMEVYEIAMRNVSSAKVKTIAKPTATVLPACSHKVLDGAISDSVTQ